ncbi:tyrosine-type recombinase/integrase [Rhizobium ruizarguesonis]
MKIKLTPDFVKNVEPEEGKRLEFRDTAERGLVLRVTETGNKSWSMRYDAPDGTMRRKTYQYPATGLSRARELIRKLKGQVTEGRDVIAEERKAKADAKADAARETLSNVATAYFAACLVGTQRIGKKVRIKAPGTLANEKRVWKTDIEPKFGKRLVATLEKKEIIQWVDTLTNRSPSAGRAGFHLLRQVLNFAVTRDIIPMNPAPHVAVKEAEPRKRWLTDDELRKIWALLNDIEARAEVEISDEMALLLQMMLVTPLRASEVAGMAWAEIDGDVWTVPALRMKGKREHVMPLSKPAIAILARARQVVADDELVFRSTRTGRRLHAASIGAAFKRIVEHLKIPRATPHDYRRTFLTNVCGERVGIPRALGKLLLAHADHDVAAVHYDMNSYLPEKRRIADAWAGLLMSIVAETPRDGGGKVIEFPRRRA